MSFELVGYGFVVKDVDIWLFIANTLDTLLILHNF